MKAKRLLAYLIDMLITLCISCIIFALPFFKNSYDNYVEVSESAMKELKNTNLTDEEVISIEYNVYKSSSNLLIVRIGVTFLYFGVLGFIFNGKTLGKKIFRLRITPYNEDNFNVILFMIRSIIVTGLLFDIISIFVLVLCRKAVWLEVNSIFGILSYIVYMVILFSMMFRTDGRGIHDLICKTIVVEERK